MQHDPLGYVDGMSMYGYVGGGPLGSLDPFGLQVFVGDDPGNCAYCHAPAPPSMEPFPVPQDDYKVGCHDEEGKEDLLEGLAQVMDDNEELLTDLGLDAAGTAEPTPFIDLYNTKRLFDQGQYLDAGFTFLGVVPYIGDLGKVGKYTGVVADSAKAVGDFVGPNARAFVNKAGDLIMESYDGLKQVRFDFKNPAPHADPHVHTIVYEKIKNKKVKRIDERIFPKGPKNKGMMHGLRDE